MTGLANEATAYLVLDDSQQTRLRRYGTSPRTTIIWHSALEFLLTFVLLSGVVTIVRWVIGPSAIARAIPHIHLQLLVVGTVVGLLITGLISARPAAHRAAT